MAQQSKPKHIGILACSSEGAALCYRTICLESQEMLGRHKHPEITLHGFSLGDYMTSIERDNNWQPIAELMVSSAKHLTDSGCEIIVCPDNTIHQVYDSIVGNINANWLHIAEVVAAQAHRRNFKCVGIMGTRYLTEGPVYPSRLEPHAIKYMTPDETERERINEIIFDELVNGIFDQGSRNYLLSVIERLAKRGCDAVVLACTELPLIVNDGDAIVPTLDSTRLLARAAIKTACANIEASIVS